ncbi:hypothetical protein HDU76_002526 [Blyttiomyces sp. JEL0837]|nr:hypothetical protein HDU76_002526 [Blyttiomyces sp. JEL0837]
MNLSVLLSSNVDNCIDFPTKRQAERTRRPLQTPMVNNLTCSSNENNYNDDNGDIDRTSTNSVSSNHSATNNQLVTKPTTPTSSLSKKIPSYDGTGIVTTIDDEEDDEDDNLTNLANEYFSAPCKPQPQTTNPRPKPILRNIHNLDTTHVKRKSMSYLLKLKQQDGNNITTQDFDDDEENQYLSRNYETRRRRSSSDTASSRCSASRSSAHGIGYMSGTGIPSGSRVAEQRFRVQYIDDLEADDDNIPTSVFPSNEVSHHVAADSKSRGENRGGSLVEPKSARPVTNACTNDKSRASTCSSSSTSGDTSKSKANNNSTNLQFLEKLVMRFGMMKGRKGLIA